MPSRTLFGVAIAGPAASPFARYYVILALVIGLTWIVIAGTLMIALILFVADFGFTNLFQAIGILETEATS